MILLFKGFLNNRSLQNSISYYRRFLNWGSYNVLNYLVESRVTCILMSGVMKFQVSFSKLKKIMQVSLFQYIQIRIVYSKIFRSCLIHLFSNKCKGSLKLLRVLIRITLYWMVLNLCRRNSYSNKYSRFKIFNKIVGYITNSRFREKIGRAHV